MLKLLEKDMIQEDDEEMIHDDDASASNLSFVSPFRERGKGRGQRNSLSSRLNRQAPQPPFSGQNCQESAKEQNIHIITARGIYELRKL